MPEAPALFPQDIIRKKRDGGALDRRAIETWIRGVVDGGFADYQSSALLMAIFQRGMSPRETAWLTEAMMRSGEVITLPEITAPKVDKHSTGGVGDKVSLILGPLAAAAGVCVPMISGRGLGHTGGTLDKLESIPGFRVGLSTDEYRRQLAALGLALAGQTASLVPADRKLYALRDVTATVECVPLICASIMSKKLAEGIDALVLDVKFGRGAFMKSLPEARRLARAMVAIGKAMQRPTVALLTEMNRPLGRAVGHALEVIESIECLKGRGPADLMEVTLALTEKMVLLAKLEKTPKAARLRVQRALDSGAALAKFRDTIRAQGGDPAVIDDYARLPQARRIVEIRAESAGYIRDVDAMAIALSGLRLGAGRERVEDHIDPAVGLSDLAQAGTRIANGDLLARLHVNNERHLAEATALARRAFTISKSKPRLAPLIREEIA
ncbi:MAG: thymidine phosphorylase [Opitutaceae bacterium]|nr:thymidine phosphorylase [Opitutaceae bacterium]